MTGHVLI